MVATKAVGGLRWWPVYRIPSFLSGRLLLYRGSKRDYEELSRFHYLPKRPATWAEVWVVRYEEDGVRGEGSGARVERSRTVGVGVLSYPTLSHWEREAVLGLTRLSDQARVRFVNEQVRTISRVVVHPTFRSLGLARVLVRCMLHHCPTRYVEAMAVMGRAHPFFELAGMKRVEVEAMPEGRPVYYLYDRKSRGQGGEGEWGYSICDYRFVAR
ncbi:MAG: GNAT family N-acetyltransferase [Planctomycetota bacterium]|nr:GNAT family N-acetyltransferase [Planctomycetota bacterium]